MGLFDFITGTKRPEADTPRLPVEELRARLLALNKPKLPWRIVDGADQQVDLIAEWKIDDPRWKEALKEIGAGDVGGDNPVMAGATSATCRHLLKFDVARWEVRNVDRDFTVEWGREGLEWHASASWFRGQARSWGGATFSYDIKTGKTQKSKALGNEDFKVPIRKIVTDAGWTYRCVVLGKL